MLFRPMIIFLNYDLFVETESARKNGYKAVYDKKKQFW